jgi:hypothetical protein
LLERVQTRIAHARPLLAVAGAASQAHSHTQDNP